MNFLFLKVFAIYLEVIGVVIGVDTHAMGFFDMQTTGWNMGQRCMHFGIFPLYFKNIFKPAENGKNGPDLLVTVELVQIVSENSEDQLFSKVY